MAKLRQLGNPVMPSNAGDDSYGGPGGGEPDYSYLDDEPEPEAGPLSIQNPTPTGSIGPLPTDPNAGGSGEVGRSAESPRERTQNLGGDAPATPQATLRRPMSPTPMAGSQFTGGSTESGGTASMPPMGGGPGGVLPFTPLGKPDPVMSAMPQLRGLYGQQGGLKGGGLGVPGATSLAENDPIEGLIQLLMKQGGQV